VTRDVTFFGEAFFPIPSCCISFPLPTLETREGAELYESVNSFESSSNMQTLGQALLRNLAFVTRFGSSVPGQFGLCHPRNHSPRNKFCRGLYHASNRSRASVHRPSRRGSGRVLSTSSVLTLCRNFLFKAHETRRMRHLTRPGSRQEAYNLTCLQSFIPLLHG
jgi:hypothetical protein